MSKGQEVEPEGWQSDILRRHRREEKVVLDCTPTELTLNKEDMNVESDESGASSDDTMIEGRGPW